MSGKPLNSNRPNNPETQKALKAEPQPARTTPERKRRQGGGANSGPQGGASGRGGAFAQEERGVAWPRSNPRVSGSSGSALPRQGLREMVVHHRVPKRAVTTPLRKGGKETRAGPVITAPFPEPGMET